MESKIGTTAFVDNTICVESQAFEANQGDSTSVMFLMVILFLCTLSYIWMNLTKTARSINAFPGPRSWPIIGNLNILWGKTEELQKKIQTELSKYGTHMRLWIGFQPYLIVADGTIAEKVLSGHGNLEKGQIYSAFKTILDESITTANPIKWKNARKHLAFGFTSKNYDGFLKIFNEQSQTLVKVLRQKVEHPEYNATTGENILPYFNRCTLDSVFQTTFGSKQDAQENPELDFVEQLKGIIKSTREKLLKPYLNLPIVWNTFGYGKLENECLNFLMNFTGKIIDAKYKEKEATGDVKGTHTRPFLAFLMDGISDRRDIAFHTNALSFAGSETSASTLNYLLFLLALNPGYQKRVIEEVDNILGSSGVDNEVNMEDLGELKFTEMCIKEALRLYPPVPAWVRRISNPVDLGGGKIIPEGTQVPILAFEIHRNPKVFPEPEVFRPERFDEIVNDKIPPGWWIPFSYGPRNCIGNRYAMMQLKTLTAYIFKYFTVETSTASKDLKFVYGLVLEPIPDIKLILKKRDCNV